MLETFSLDDRRIPRRPPFSLRYRLGLLDESSIRRDGRGSGNEATRLGPSLANLYFAGQSVIAGEREGGGRLGAALRGRLPTRPGQVDGQT